MPYFLSVHRYIYHTLFSSSITVIFYPDCLTIFDMLVNQSDVRFLQIMAVHTMMISAYITWVRRIRLLVARRACRGICRKPTRITSSLNRVVYRPLTLAVTHSRPTIEPGATYSSGQSASGTTATYASAVSASAASYVYRRHDGA